MEYCLTSWFLLVVSCQSERCLFCLSFEFISQFVILCQDNTVNCFILLLILSCIQIYHFILYLTPLIRGDQGEIVRQYYPMTTQLSINPNFQVILIIFNIDKD